MYICVCGFFLLFFLLVPFVSGAVSHLFQYHNQRTQNKTALKVTGLKKILPVDLNVVPVLITAGPTHLALLKNPKHFSTLNPPLGRGDQIINLRRDRLTRSIRLHPHHCHLQAKHTTGRVESPDHPRCTKGKGQITPPPV